jgi:hypothetical protein
MTLAAVGAIALLAFVVWRRVLRDRRADEATREVLCKRFSRRPDRYE